MSRDRAKARLQGILISMRLDARTSDATHLVPICFGKFHGRGTALNAPAIDHDVNLTTHEFQGAIKDGSDGVEVCEITDGNVGSPAKSPNGVARGSVGFVALDETYVRAWMNS